MLEAYVRGCGREYRRALLDQVQLLDALTVIATDLHSQPNEKRLEFLRSELETLKIPKRFTLPLFSDVEMGGINIGTSS